MAYENLKLTTIDTPEQVEYCQTCKKSDCNNCMSGYRRGQVPGTDPCINCYSKSVCHSKTCSDKRKYLNMVSHNAELLDKEEASYGLYKHVLKPGYDIFILHNKNVVRSRVHYVDAKIIETEHDFYYWNEHGKLWWLTRRGSNDKAR